MSDLTTAFVVTAGPLGPTIMAAEVAWAVPFWALKTDIYEKTYYLEKNEKKKLKKY
jgi:hypothetical protein